MSDEDDAVVEALSVVAGEEERIHASAQATYGEFCELVDLYVDRINDVMAASPREAYVVASQVSSELVGRFDRQTLGILSGVLVVRLAEAWR